MTLLPCSASAEEVLERDPDLVFLANGPGDPGGARLRGRERPRAGRQEAGVRASASATSCSAARSASRPSSSPSATAAPTTRSRTSRPAGSTSPRRTTASRSLGPGGERTIEGDEPVRWETDFGAAELSHLNLYDRTVEGLVLKDVPGCTVQYHPEAGPGPHDARYLFDRFLELAGSDGARELETSGVGTRTRVTPTRRGPTSRGLSTLIPEIFDPRGRVFAVAGSGGGAAHLSRAMKGSGASSQSSATMTRARFATRPEEYEPAE